MAKTVRENLPAPGNRSDLFHSCWRPSAQLNETVRVKNATLKVGSEHVILYPRASSSSRRGIAAAKSRAGEALPNTEVRHLERGPLKASPVDYRHGFALHDTTWTMDAFVVPIRAISTGFKAANNWPLQIHSTLRNCKQRNENGARVETSTWQQGRNKKQYKERGEFDRNVTLDLFEPITSANGTGTTATR